MIIDIFDYLSANDIELLYKFKKRIIFLIISIMTIYNM